MVDICLRLSCDRYLANNKTFNMVDRSVFSENNIKIIPQNYEHIKYNQMYDNKKINWISNLSVIDYLFNKPY